MSFARLFFCSRDQTIRRAFTPRSGNRMKRNVPDMTPRWTLWLTKLLAADIEACGFWQRLAWTKKKKMEQFINAWVTRNDERCERLTRFSYIYCRFTTTTKTGKNGKCTKSSILIGIKIGCLISSVRCLVGMPGVWVCCVCCSALFFHFYYTHKNENIYFVLWTEVVFELIRFPDTYNFRLFFIFPFFF